MQTPQNPNNSGQQSTQVRKRNPNSQGNKGQQNYICGRVNNVTAETTQDTPNVVFSMFLVSS